jgi:hypothetical protein
MTLFIKQSLHVEELSLKVDLNRPSEIAKKMLFVKITISNALNTSKIWNF